MPTDEVLQRFMDSVARSLYAGEERMDELAKRTEANSAAIQANTEITEAHRAETRELIDAFAAMKGGMKVLEAIGKFGKIIGAIALAVSAVIGAYHTVIKFFK